MDTINLGKLQPRVLETTATILGRGENLAAKQEAFEVVVSFVAAHRIARPRFAPPQNFSFATCSLRSCSVCRGWS